MTLLGVPTEYPKTYAPHILFPIAREKARAELGIGAKLPFTGFDTWACYDFTWLDTGGRPSAGVLTFTYPCESRMLIESKSMKLYLMSLNYHEFGNIQDLLGTIRHDLSEALGSSELSLNLLGADEWEPLRVPKFEAKCIDQENYTPSLNLVSLRDEVTDEILISHVWRSLCPVTRQPDYGTVVVRYSGPRIDRSSLLSHLTSYREHCGFHEECTERLYLEIDRYCKPKQLTVSILFSRRGGIDITPVRSSLGSQIPFDIPRAFRP